MKCINKTASKTPAMANGTRTVVLPTPRFAFWSIESLSLPRALPGRPVLALQFYLACYPPPIFVAANKPEAERGANALYA